MDNDSNKITWVVVILACVSLIGVFVVNTLFPTQIKNVETYISNVLDNTSGTTDTLDSITSSSKYGFKYSILNNTDRTMSINGYSGVSKNISIPSTVEYNGYDYSVISINDYAFQNMNLTSVTIPNSVTSIGIDAFYVNKLTTLVIPNSVKTMGYGAFATNNLTSVTISNSITTLNNYVFRHNKLTSVTIPDSVITINNSVFEDNDLVSVTAPLILQSQIKSNNVFINNPSTLSINYK